DRAGPKLVDLYVRFGAAEVECVIHHGATTAEGPADTGSFFNSKGLSDSSTITSSSRSRLAAGLMRITLNGAADLTSAIVPIGRFRGKIRSIPLVRTVSPAFTLSSSLGTYFIESSASPVPPTGCCARELASIAPTPLSLSVNNKT